MKGWHWESFWIIGGLFSWLIIPPLAAWLTVPNFSAIISQTSASTFWWTFFWGVLWGVGGLMYGLGMRYLGMSLGNSVLLGFTSAFGALAPSIYYNFHPQEGKTTPKEKRLSKAAALAPVLREFCSTLRGIMLGSHGLFTWGDTSCESYLHTLQVVETCAQYLEENYGK